MRRRVTPQQPGQLRPGLQHRNSRGTPLPGVTITLLGLGLLFLGDWLRDLLDLRLRGR